MNRRNVVRLALAAALFGAAIPGAALAQVSPQAKWWNPRTQDSQRFQDRFHRDLFEGRWMAQDRFDSNIGGGFHSDFRGGRRAIMLPDFLTIDQGRRVVRVADGRNHLLQVISLGNGDSGMPWNRGTLLQGDLRGNRLIATGTDPRGRQMRQVMILRDGGNTLVIRTQVERGQSGRVVEVEKVYQRA